MGGFMQSVTPGSGRVPNMHFKSAGVRDQKLRVTALDQSVQDTYHEFAKSYGLGEGHDQNNKLLAAIKNITTTYNLTVHQSDLDDAIEAVGKHVHDNQKKGKLSGNDLALVRELYVLLKVARKTHSGSTPQAVSMFSSFDRTNRYNYGNDKSLSDGRNPERSKTETAWTSYFKDVLAYESGQRGSRTFELEEMFPEDVRISSQQQAPIPVRSPNVKRTAAQGSFSRPKTNITGQTDTKSLLNKQSLSFRHGSRDYDSNSDVEEEVSGHSSSSDSRARIKSSQSVHQASISGISLSYDSSGSEFEEDVVCQSFSHGTRDYDRGSDSEIVESSIQSSPQSTSNSQPQQHSAPNTNALVPTDLKSDFSHNEDEEYLGDEDAISRRLVPEQNTSNSPHTGTRQEPTSLGNDPPITDELKKRSAIILQRFIRNNSKQALATPSHKNKEDPASLVSDIWHIPGEIKRLGQVNQVERNLQSSSSIGVFDSFWGPPTVLSQQNLLSRFDSQANSGSKEEVSFTARDGQYVNGITLPQPPVRIKKAPSRSDVQEEGVASTFNSQGHSDYSKITCKSSIKPLQEDRRIIEDVLDTSHRVTATVGSSSFTDSQISFLSSSIVSDPSKVKKRTRGNTQPKTIDKQNQEQLKSLRERRDYLTLKQVEDSLSEKDQQERLEIEERIANLTKNIGSRYTTVDEQTISGGSKSKKQSVGRVQSTGDNALIAVGSSINPQSQDQSSRRRILHSQSLDGTKQLETLRYTDTASPIQSGDGKYSTKSYTPLQEKIKKALGLPSSSDSNSHPPDEKPITLTDAQKGKAKKSVIGRRYSDSEKQRWK